MEKVEIQFNYFKLTLILVASIVFLGLGVGILLFSNDNIMEILSVFIIIMFFFATIFSFKKIIKKQPAIILDSKGISDNSTMGSFGFLPWKDIQSVFLTEFKGQSYISFEVNHKEATIKKLPAMVKMLSKVNGRALQTPFNIRSNILNYKFEKLLAVVKQHHEYYKKL